MKKERGNVLFLILIAVALFAALSYAVTQSSRGGGNADKETQVIEVAEILQFVAGARTAVQRMILNGVDPADIELCFSGSPNFCGLGDGFNDFCTTGTNCIFAPEGGGLAHPRVFNSGTIYLNTPANAFIVDGVGTAAAEMVMQFEGITGGVVTLSEEACVAFNEAVGVSTTLLEEATANGIAADGIALSGQWDFCYDANTGAGINYISTHVIYAG